MTVPGEADAVVLEGWVGLAAFGVRIASVGVCAVAAGVVATVAVVAGVAVSESQPDKTELSARAEIEIHRKRTARRM
ncbi:hypothetical protein [Nocardia nova]|uniref:hypothetical protein n=1 Tax=Nocardia nova TaxID=37330 RepID=UPI001E3AF532|nr:hypothetical protein [Nocardia nova]